MEPVSKNEELSLGKLRHERDDPSVIRRLSISSQVQAFYKSDNHLDKVRDHSTLHKAQSKSWPLNSAKLGVGLGHLGLDVPSDLGVGFAQGIDAEQVEPNVSNLVTLKEINHEINSPGDTSATVSTINSSSPTAVRTPRERKKWVRPSSTLRSEPLESSLPDSAHSKSQLSSRGFQQTDYFGNLFVSLPEQKNNKQTGVESQERSEKKNKNKSQLPSSNKPGKSFNPKDLACSSDFDFKSALDVSLDASGQRIPSPASSNTSNKLRGLEWDSGADVGYRHPTDTSLSTIERLVLARGSTVFHLQSAVVQVEAEQGSKREEPLLTHHAPSGPAPRATKPQRMSHEPLAQSTPIEVQRQSLILIASNVDEASRRRDDMKVRKLSRKKSLSSSDLHSACPFPDESKDIPGGKSNQGSIGFSNKSANQKHSFPSSTPEVVESKSETSNKLVQTSNLTNTQSVGVQVESAGSWKESSSASAEETRKPLFIEDAEKFIERIKNKAKAHQKVIDNIGQSNTYPRTSGKSVDGAHGLFKHQADHNHISSEKACCSSDCKGAHKKVGNSAESANEQSASSSRASLHVDDESKSGSSSSSYVNYTPRSGNATNDRETIGSANSFEYLPGDAYEHTKAKMKDSSSVPANSLSRDLELGVEALLQHTKNADPKQIKLLVQKLKEKLILTDYTEDSNSSAVDKSGLNEPTNRNRHTGHGVVSGSSDSVYKSATSLFEAHNHKQLTDTMESGHSTYPCNWSSSLSSSSTLETRNWRDAVTKSEKRLEQRWASKKAKSNFSDKQLADINEKIHHLSNLKIILERQEKLRTNCAIKPYKFAKSAVQDANLNSVKKDNSRSSDINESDTTRPSDSGQQNIDWSSHVRLAGNKRNIQTQMPSARYGLSSQKESSSEKQHSSCNTDTRSELRTKQGRINVYVQTRQKSNTAAPCGCQHDSVLTEKGNAQQSSTGTTFESSPCPTKASLKVKPQDKYQPKQNLRPASGNPQEMQMPNLCHRCKCPLAEERRSFSSDHSGHLPLNTRARPDTSTLDRKRDQASDSISVQPIVKPAWFSYEGEPTENNSRHFETLKTKLPSHDAKFDTVQRADVRTLQMENRRFCRCHENVKACQCKSFNGNVDLHRLTDPETPRPIGYMLNFESSTSIDSNSRSEFSTIERRPLEVVTIRVPSKSRKQKQDSARTAYRSLGVVNSPPRSAPAQSSTPQRRYTATHWEEKGDGGTKLKPTLQECLQNNRPDYIQSADCRRQCLSELAHLRELRRESRQRLLALASQPGPRLSSQPMPPPPMAVKRVFTQQKMLRQTKKLQQKCSEELHKKVEMKRKEDYRTNRLMAEIFTRKLQKKVLQGAVSLSNSVSVISTLDV